MRNFDPVFFGRQVAKEAGARGWGVQKLQQKLSEQTNDARGTSYGAVWSIMKGQASIEPRRKVVEGLAQLFGVRPDYLLYGGARTDLETSFQAELEAEEGAPDDGFRSRLLERVPLLRELEDDRSIEAQFVACGMGYVATTRRLGLARPPADAAVWEDVCDFLNAHITAPFQFFDETTGERVLRVDAEMYALYVGAALHALRLALKVIQTDRKQDDAEAEGNEERPPSLAE